MILDYKLQRNNSWIVLIKKAYYMQEYNFERVLIINIPHFKFGLV